ncbi:MAG: arylesterase [Hyphomicrobiaceae bacterium]
MILRHLGQMVLMLAAVNLAASIAAKPGHAEVSPGPIHVVALGDSLTAGLGLGAADALPAVLQRLLTSKGHQVEIQNAGVSGDTTAGGLARLDWAVPEGTQAVILALGANDMLGGLDVQRARNNLEAIIRRLQARNIAVLLLGMRASRTLGDSYADAFDRMFPELADKYGLILYPFLLDGVALDPKLNQQDGIHPNAEGVRRIAERMLPFVEKLLARVKSERS